MSDELSAAAAVQTGELHQRLIDTGTIFWAAADAELFGVTFQQAGGKGPTTTMQSQKWAQIGLPYSFQLGLNSTPLP